jgi:hypothetical protein
MSNALKTCIHLPNREFHCNSISLLLLFVLGQESRKLAMIEFHNLYKDFAMVARLQTRTAREAQPSTMLKRCLVRDVCQLDFNDGVPMVRSAPVNGQLIDAQAAKKKAVQMDRATAFERKFVSFISNCLKDIDENRDFFNIPTTGQQYWRARVNGISSVLKSAHARKKGFYHGEWVRYTDPQSKQSSCAQLQSFFSNILQRNLLQRCARIPISRVTGRWRISSCDS